MHPQWFVIYKYTVIQRRWQTTRRFNCVALGQRPLHGLGLYMSRHSGCQSLKPCCHKSRRSGDWRWTSEIDEISLAGGFIQLHASGGRITGCTWRGGVRLLQRSWTPDHGCHNWAEILPVPHAAAECDSAARQCRMCARNCAGVSRIGRSVLYLAGVTTITFTLTYSCYIWCFHLFYVNKC